MPRTDTTFHFLSVGQYGETRTWTGGSVAPAGSDTTSGYVTVSPIGRLTRDWFNTPNYYLIRKAKAPLSARGFSTRSSRGRVWVGGQGLDVSFNPFEGTVTTSRYLSQPIDWSDRDIIRSLQTDDELYIKAAMAVKDSKTWDGPLFMAELHKSASMIANTALTTAKALSAIKSGNFVKAMEICIPSRKGARFQRGAASGILAYKYGVQPLLKDAQDYCDALSAIAFRHWDSEQPTRIRVSQKKTGFLLEDYVYLVSPQDIAGKVELAVSDSRRLYVEYKVTDPQSYALARFGLTNPLTTVWDLVPFSFVFDWFSNWNKWLSSLDAGVGLTFTNCYISRKRQTTMSPTGNMTHSAYYNLHTSASGSAFVVQAERETLPSLPTAMPQGITFNPGLLKTKVGDTLPTLSASRLTSALALLRQLT